uniref:Nuclear receptor domain-containing protein n=1 Tax=Meloidogyne incognita TaxID=6306 RepID=A0A914KVV7_MELIC
MENEDHKNIEDGIDIGGNKEEINVWNQKDLKIQKQSAKTKRNLNPHPTACSICERIASGYLFYGVICCYSCKHFFNRCITSKSKYNCEKDGNCNLSHSNYLQLNYPQIYY